MVIIGPEAQKFFKTFGLSVDQQQNLKIINGTSTQYFTSKTNYTFKRYKFNQIRQNLYELFKDFF